MTSDIMNMQERDGEIAVFESSDTIMSYADAVGVMSKVEKRKRFKIKADDASFLAADYDAHLKKYLVSMVSGAGQYIKYISPEEIAIGPHGALYVGEDIVVYLRR